MAEETYIFLFGDQTENYRSLLDSLLRLKPDPLLESFLSTSYTHLRAEILQHHDSRNHVSLSFSTLLELLTVSSLPPSQQVALDHGLSSICHFALFFHHLGQRCGGVFPIPKGCYLGICTGSLAAAAVEACKTPLELLSVSVQVCILSYRLGFYAAETGTRYDRVRDQRQSWAVTVPGFGWKDALDVIDWFVDPTVGKHYEPYVGVVGDRATTIYAPPSIIQQLQKRIKTAVFSLPVWAPYHASHIYGSAEVESLLDDFQFSSGEVRDGLLNSVRAILIHQVDFSELASTLKSHLVSTKEAVLIPLASSAGQSLCKHLSPTSIQLAEAIIKPNSDNHPVTSQFSNRCEIAIVGVSCRLPEADSVQEFWRLVYEGRDIHQIVPQTRWDASTHVDTSDSPRKNTSRTPYGCWLRDAGLFDAGFFGMTPRECEQVDPAQRLALLTAYEALEDGGIVPGMGLAAQRDRVGVCYGVTSNDWMETNSAQDIDAHFIPGGNRAFIPGRISYSLKVSGPSLSVDTACSSSAAAIHAGCNLLWQGEADTIIAGGTNVLTNPDFTAGLDRGHFLSRTGNCRTFDDEADGYCRGEGVVSLVLKRLPDAIADGDDVKALILNVTSNHSAEAASLTRPSLQAQRDIFTRTLNGLSPSLVSYVEMHGTGTQIGDATEMDSLLHVVASPKQNRISQGEILYLGSVKANVGHGEAVAAATGLVKILSMMEHDTIPPHIGIKTRINRRFPSDLTSNRGGVRIPSSPVEWSASKPRYALLNSFNAAGGNTTLLLRDGPTRDRGQEGTDPRGSHPVVISAKSATALSRNMEALASHLREKPCTSLPSLSYTTTARRMHHPFRAAFSVSSVQQLVSALESERAQVSRTLKSPPVVFAFTGQGSQDLTAARDAYFNLPRVVKANVEEHDAIARRAGAPSFLHLLTTDEKTTEMETSTTTIQLAILSLQMALTKLWLSWGVHPVGVIGHSLGHYAALAAAGVISEADAIFLVGMRARLVGSTCRPGTHKMLYARSSEAKLTMLMEECDASSVEVACVNGPRDVVLSGERCDIDTIHARLMAEKISCRLLDVDYAFHSSQMDNMLEDFASTVSGIRFHHPALIPVLYPDGKDASDLISHARQRVDVVSALDSGKRQGVVTDKTVFVELGHASTVASMVKVILGESTTAVPTLSRNRDAWSTVSHAMSRLYEAGLDIRWDRYHDEFRHHLRVLSLPLYRWDLRNYWIPYRNSWSLRKGDGEPLSTTKTTTTIHQIIDDQLPSSLTLRTDLTSPIIRSVIQGHRVKGVSLVTPSFYVDIALSASHHLQRNTNFSFIQDHQPCIREMTIMKALIPSQTSHIRTEISIESNNRRHLNILFSSVNQDIKTTHARCKLHYEPIPPTERLDSLRSEAGSLTAKLNLGLEDGTSYRFNKAMIYRMVAVLADFDACYKGLNTVVLDSGAMEASGVVSLPSSDAAFTVHPAHLDALMQLPGFVMNANDASDLEVKAFVNHGWDELTLFEPLKPAVVYQSCVRMRRHDDSVWKGTMTVVSGQRTVALVEGITMQGLHPRLLNSILKTASITSQTPHINNNSNHNDAITAIIAEESGIPPENLSDDTDLSSIGIDSLLALLITSRLREELGFHLEPSVSIFDRFRTLAELKEGFSGGKDLDTGSSELERELSHQEHTKTLSNHTQQPATPLKPTLFLLPDGSGSPTSYSALTLPQTHTLIALPSPYKHNPKAMLSLPLDELIESYIAEIQLRQPRGPYLLGGWSSGGILAYRAAQMLLQRNFSVRAIILIDSPPPLHGLEPLPPTFYRHCIDERVIGRADGQLPAWLLPHFEATIDLLSSYRPTRLVAGEVPDVFICWAGQPALPGFRLRPEHGQGVRFLTERRGDFGPAGWEELVPRGKLSTHVLEGFDHFGIMKGDGACALAAWLTDVLAQLGNGEEGHDSR
ncbi:hypothetical protein CP533_1781 [Ophiocordyceps camponoti-saundersi (nom. inval.)]|nr:hypothetical protein CP533_1781 [Ophiocordyceps camponoti-saundersi (nom. inval.)]